MISFDQLSFVGASVHPTAVRGPVVPLPAAVTLPAAIVLPVDVSLPAAIALPAVVLALPRLVVLALSRLVEEVVEAHRLSPVAHHKEGSHGTEAQRHECEEDPDPPLAAQTLVVFLRGASRCVHVRAPHRRGSRLHHRHLVLAAAGEATAVLGLAHLVGPARGRPDTSHRRTGVLGARGRVAAGRRVAARRRARGRVAAGGRGPGGRHAGRRGGRGRGGRRRRGAVGCRARRGLRVVGLTRAHEVLRHGLVRVVALLAHATRRLPALVLHRLARGVHRFAHRLHVLRELLGVVARTLVVAEDPVLNVVSLVTLAQTAAHLRGLTPHDLSEVPGAAA
eukprot:Rhum_TRINITY_DN14616_c7_g1::Rhum_TRINITY_DN14616_c7_g1_i1::g.102299::m.102299